MNKQKKLLILILCTGLFSVVAFAKNVKAAGSATVSWTPPTTDEGGGALTGLTGYRVYYDTVSHWASSCPTNVGNFVNITNGATTSYSFNNTLTAGQRYYFAVVAYDASGNLSGCATGANGVTEVSKLITENDPVVAPVETPVVVTTVVQSSSKSSSSKSKKKKSSPSRSVSNSKKTIKYGQKLIQRGKKFSKKSFVLLYFSKAGGGYYAPQKVKTSSSGSFSLTYRVNKPKGKYSWYAVDVKTGKKSKVTYYTVK
ncbi:MAG TPA: hypothetical protein DEA43_03650 [Candidatus Moranbacteria bacterium]|nr:fibronectin type III domain-containing protein [Candidatus Moranbacteria bacterium]HBI33913.1 hypothetical protein [Candidatus Moranbacteria bacterium]HBT45951.1 hypothetical protein [Candidatus Moranbacteria bacterium]